MRTRLRQAGEQGETLLELVVSIAILGVCVVAIGSAIAISVLMSRVHRAQSVASEFLHNYAEAVQSAYTACSGGTPPNYVTVASLAAPTGFSTPTASVKFWNPAASSFTTTSCPGTDPGLQQVTFTLSSADGTVSESVVTIVRSSA